MQTCASDCLSKDLTSCTRLCDLMAECLVVIGSTIEQGHPNEDAQTQIAQDCICRFLS